jgi:hypothetical protein
MDVRRHQSWPPFYQMDTDVVDYVKFEYIIRNNSLKKGCINRVYVQVHNRGTKDASVLDTKDKNVMIKLPYAKALNNGSNDKPILNGPNLPNIPENFWKVFLNKSVDLG